MYRVGFPAIVVTVTIALWWEYRIDCVKIYEGTNSVYLSLSINYNKTILGEIIIYVYYFLTEEVVYKRAALKTWPFPNFRLAEEEKSWRS